MLDMIVDAVYTLKKHGLEPNQSVNAAITKIGLDIGESTNQLAAANKIIVSLGMQPVGHPIQANIIAKALIEQAVLAGENYNVDEAIIVANFKYQRILKTMPYVFAGSDEGSAVLPSKTSNTSSVSDKKQQALVIYNRERGKTGGEIAKIIACELDITVPNAYYYVSRVFAKYTK